MTKKRSQRKRRKRGKRSSGKPVDGGFTPPIARTLVEQAATAEPDYSEDNLIRIMQHSATLHHEPEFSDLYLDPMQTLEAAARHFARFQRQVTRAMRRGREPTTDIYDDYRIAVLDDMDTLQLRQQLRRRLDRYINRPKRDRDAAKLESALFLRVLLDDKANKLVKGKKPLPLGVYALVTVMYEDSFVRAMEEIPTAREIVGNDLYRMWCARRHKKDMQIITTAVEQIDAFAELEERIKADPALALVWKRQELFLIEEFQTKILQTGLRISPDFFTPDEAMLALDKMERQYLSRPWSLSRYFPLLAFPNFAECVRETLAEILTPQRIVEMSDELKSLGQYCLEADNDSMRPLASHIQAAIHHLEREASSQNQVAATLYLVQSLHAAIGDIDALSPRLQRFFKRMEKSRIIRKMGVKL